MRLCTMSARSIFVDLRYYWIIKNSKTEKTDPQKSGSSLLQPSSLQQKSSSARSEDENTCKKKQKSSSLQPSSLQTSSLQTSSLRPSSLQPSSPKIIFEDHYERWTAKSVTKLHHKMDWARWASASISWCAPASILGVRARHEMEAEGAPSEPQVAPAPASVPVPPPEPQVAPAPAPAIAPAFDINIPLRIPRTLRGRYISKENRLLRTRHLNSEMHLVPVHFLLMHSTTIDFEL